MIIHISFPVAEGVVELPFVLKRGKREAVWNTDLWQSVVLKTF